jgi:serine kinase of HPr protein (carbohydrate metabolism regulator)
MHACGLVDRGDGYLFCGRSGAGKSTSAGLWQREPRVLNDDRVLIQRSAHGDY